MDTALDMATGLRPLDRKIVIYWTIATHTLKYQKVFPILVIRGPFGTGKTQCLIIISKFAHNPQRFNASLNTIAVIKDQMIASYEGTLIIEEADHGGFAYDNRHKTIVQFEQFLLNRYGKYSADITSKLKTDRDSWVNVKRSMFGASAIHSRTDFTDAALDGRSISVHTYPDNGKPYLLADDMGWIDCKLQDVVFEPHEVVCPDQIAQRIFNTYRPVLMAAQYCNDNDFTDSLLDKLRRDSEDHKAAQSMEPIGLVFRAIFNIASTQEPTYSNIKLSSIVKWILENYDDKYTPRVVGGLARSLGFKVKESHGVGVVMPSPVRLLEAFDKVGYDDPEAELELREKILKMSPEEREWE